MTAVVVSTIGTGGDYSTLQAWEDAAPADLVAADQIWEGQCQNQAFTTASAQILLIAGSTSDSTHYKHLTTAPGASFRDHATAATNPLKFDASKGASISGRATYDLIVRVDEDYSHVSNLQFSGNTDAQQFGVIFIPGSNTVFRNCIFENNGVNGEVFGAGGGAVNHYVINCLFVNRANQTGNAGVAARFYQSPIATNCTFAIPSDKAAPNGAVRIQYPSGHSFKNCAFFGGTTAVWESFGAIAVTTGFTTCFTDSGSPPAGVTQVAYDTTTGSGFRGTVDASHDFRIKGSSALRNTGTDGGAFAAADIIGKTRVGGWDVGAWETVTVTTVKTIGLGGDYTTLQAWEDAAPADLVADDVIWRGECLNQTLDGGASPALVVAGSTTDAERYKELTAQAGASFVDHPTAATNPLRIDAAKGALITSAVVYDNTIASTEGYFRISRLQVAMTHTSGGAALTIDGGGSTVVDRCIFESVAGGVSPYRQPLRTYNTLVSNCLVVQRGASPSWLVATSNTTSFKNCTFISINAATHLLLNNYATVDFVNCAAFGIVNANSLVGVTNKIACYTNASANNSGWNLAVFDTTTGSGFENITDGTHDFRIKSTSALKDAGTVTSDARTDIVGRARGPWYGDVGAWEYVAQKTVAVGGIHLPRVRTTPPLRPVGIDRDNPRARNLEFAWYPGCVTDVAGGGRATLRAGSSSGGGKFGQHLASSISGFTNTGAEFTGGYPFDVGAENLTFMVFMNYFRSATTDNAALMTVSSFALSIDSSNRFWIDRNGAGTTSIGTITPGKPFSGAITFRSGSPGAIYLNGDLDSTYTDDGRTGVGPVSTLIGTDSVVSTDAAIALALVFTRQLSASEVKSIALNPWQLFKPDRIRLGFSAPLPSVGGAIARYYSTTQPPQEQLVDPSSPLSQGLMFCLTPQNRVRDSTGQVVVTRNATERLVGFPRAGGVATQYDGQSSYTDFHTHVEPFNPSAGPDGWWAIAVEGIYQTPYYYNTLVGGSGNGLYFDTSGYLRLYLASSLQLYSSIVLYPGEYFRLICWGKDAVSSNFIMNGVFDTAPNIGYGGFGPVNQIGGQIGTGTGNHSASLVCVWQGYSEARIKSWLANPWGMFVDRRRTTRGGFGFPSAGPPPTLYGSLGQFDTFLRLKAWF